MSTPWIGKIRRRLEELNAPEDCPRILAFLGKCGCTKIYELDLKAQEKLCNSLLRIKDKAELYEDSTAAVKPQPSEPQKPLPPMTQRGRRPVSEAEDLSDMIAEIEVHLKRLGYTKNSLPFRNLLRSFGVYPADFINLDGEVMNKIIQELKQCT